MTSVKPQAPKPERDKKRARLSSLDMDCRVHEHSGEAHQPQGPALNQVTETLWASGTEQVQGNEAESYAHKVDDDRFD
jgi:hypothetical protein